MFTRLAIEQEPPKGARGVPLRGHPYWTKSPEELRFIMKDAKDAADANRDGDPKVEGKYLDQMNDAATILYYRKNHGGYAPAGYGSSR
jgi:hypothetical protein